MVKLSDSPWVLFKREQTVERTILVCSADGRIRTRSGVFKLVCFGGRCVQPFRYIDKFTTIYYVLQAAMVGIEPTPRAARVTVGSPP